jgi:hypothetical protein
MEHQQLELFANIPLKSGCRTAAPVMDARSLVQWKSRILTYQQKIRDSPPPLQTSLFQLAPTHCDPDRIDPFRLTLQSMAFYRMPDLFGQAALYFVIDSAVGLLLYVGETCQSHKRWKHTHDCKDYITSYQDLHYRYQMVTAVNIGFWWDAPIERKARQALEQATIQKWRSPFNQEMWDLWGQPFQS